MRKTKSRLLEAIRTLRANFYASVETELSNENRTYRENADAHGISLATVQRIAERSGVSRPVGPRSKSSTAQQSGAEGQEKVWDDLHPDTEVK